MSNDALAMEVQRLVDAAHAGSEWAVTFGSYLENYGAHHEWCPVAKGESSLRGACTCGFFAALDDVRLWHEHRAQAETLFAASRKWLREHTKFVGMTCPECGSADRSVLLEPCLSLSTSNNTTEAPWHREAETA